MARRGVQYRVAQYFLKISDDENDPFYQCLIENCKSKPLSGQKKYNLVSHAKTHKAFYKQHFEMDDDKLLEMPAKRLQFIQDSTEMVTVSGLPFAALNGTGFKRLIAEKLQDLTDAGFGMGLKAPQCEAVRKQIPYLAMEIMNQIKEEVKYKFVSLMVDTASKFQRSILGISIQYMLGSAITVRTIGMINLTASHTAQHIATEILNRLSLFEIKTTQLIAVTTDNASNMTAMIQRFNEMFGQDADIVDDNLSDVDDSQEEINPVMDKTGENVGDFQFHLTNETEVNSDISTVVEEMESADPEHSEDLVSIIDDFSQYEKLLQDLEALLAKHTLNINGIRCAAHTLQLAVQSALKVPEFQILIRLCRAVCKELRKSSRQYELEKQNIASKIPRIDCKTRWNSTYSMVRIREIAIIDEFAGILVLIFLFYSFSSYRTWSCIAKMPLYILRNKRKQ